MASETPHPENCPRCGHGAAADHRFCAECGFDLAVQTCPSCDAPNDPGAKFCTACGGAMTDEPAVVAEPDQPVSEAPLSAESPTPAAPEPPTPEVDEGPPADWEPPPAPELPDIRTPIPESIIGEPIPLEPRRVPAEGMAAWSLPDAATQPETQLAAGTGLLVMERTGAWAHVMGDNGWKGWVDDRLLIDPDLAEAAQAPFPPPHDTAPAPKRAGPITRPFTVAGAVTAVIAIFVPWIGSGSGINGFDVPVAMLVNITTADSSFSVGIVLLALGGFAAAIALVPNLAKLSNLLVPLGIGLVAVGGLFIYQIARDPFVDLADYLAAGPIVTIAAGVLVLTRR